MKKVATDGIYYGDFWSSPIDGNLYVRLFRRNPEGPIFHQ